MRGAEVRAPAHPALPTADLRAAARATETEPSLAQIEAGNYAKGKYKWNGLTISLENPKGSIRRAVDGSWEQTMAHHYGYIRGTLDRTGEQIDTFIGPNPKSDQVYVIEQEHQGSGIFDEPKVMIGFGTVEEAKRGYLDNYPRGWKVGPVVPMNVEQFKTWLEGGNTKARPSEIPIEQLIPGLTPELQARAEQIRDQYARGEISDKAYAKFVEKLRSRWSPPEAPAAKPQGAHTVEGIRDEINATEFGRRVSNMVEPVARINDLPEYIYEDVKDKGDFAINNVNGVWDPISRKVYLVAANTDPGSVNQTLLHELVGHYGVESILGPKFSEFLRQVYDSNAPAIQQQARAGFLVPYNLDFTKAAHREIAASEYIAYTAERGENPSLWQRFVAKVREILRSMGFVKEWSENDIRNLLRRSRNSLMHGGDVSYNGETPYEFGQPDYTSGREVQAPRRKGATLYGEPKGKSVESHVSQSDLEARKEYWRKNMPESAVIRATPMWETGPKYSVRQTTFAKDDAGHPLLSGELVDVVNPRFVREQPNGVRIYTHDILVGKTHVGVVMLGWQGDTVTDLPFIAVFPKFKGLGLGEDVVRSILEHNGGKPLRAVLVLAQARTFWSKMGAKFEATEEGEDGILTYQNYLAQNRGRGAARAGGTVATRESAVEEINAGSETAPGAEVPRQRYSIRDPKGLSQVYGVKDGRLQGVAIKSYRGGIWEVYIGKEGNPTLFAQGDFDRIQASDIGEVQRIFNQKGLEFRAIKPTNIPIPDRSIFDRNWVAPTADTFFKRATIYLQNRLLLPELQERVIAREVGPIPEEAKAHREARLAHPRAAGKMADFDHQYTEPIIEEMRKARLTLREVGDYLYARHAEERNVAIEQINPENKSGSGMPTEEAQATLRTLQQDTNRWAALERIGKLVNEVNKVREQIMVDKGLAKPQAIALLRAKYKNYVPLKEMAEDEYIQSPIGGGYQVGRVINTAFGRFTRANSDLILPASIAQAKGTIAAGENAEVLRALLRQAEFAPNPDVWRLQKAVWKPYLDRDTGEVRYAPRPVQMDANYGSRAISIPVDGDRHVLIVSDQRFADAFKRSGLPLPDFMQTIGTVTRFYALMATAANPEFVVTNLMRDFQQAMIRLTGEKSPALASKVAKDMIPALWGAFSGLRAQGQYTPGESAKPLAEAWHSWYRRFIEAGGQVAYRGIADVETQHKDFLRSLADAGIYPESLGGFQSVLLKAHRAAKVSGAKFFTKLVTDANGAVENALRLSTFKNLVEAGYTEKDAAFAARNVTVDFNLKGEASTRIGALWMFFNANMQGNALLVRSVINSKGVRWLAYALFFMGMAMDAWNRRHANENKDGRTSYDNISSDMKEKNFVLMAPDGDNAITVPFSFGFNIFYMAGVNAMATIDGAQKPLKSAMNVVIGAMNAFNPMGQTPTTSLGTLQLISPTSSDPAVQAMTNRDWRDKTIVPERPKFAPPQSKAETYYSGTPPMYVDSARWLNEMSGGNEVRSGILDISPNMLRHWVNSVFGSAGATYARIADIVHATATDKELETRDIPIVRRFYYEPKDFELSHRFYEHLNEAEVAHFEVRRAYEGNRGEQARLLQEEYRGERSMYQEGVAAERTVGQIRSQIAHLRKDERVPEDVKKKRIEQAEEQSRRIMMQFNARFESSVDR